MGVKVGDYIYDISIGKSGGVYRSALIEFAYPDPDIIADYNYGIGMFEVGQTVTISGSASNDGNYKVVASYYTHIRVDATLTAEGPGPTITITGSIITHGFLTVPTSAEFRRRANDFAPVIGVPGMQLEYQEDIWRPWTLGDFRGGIGQEEWKDPTRFYEMTPGIRIYKNRLTLDTQIVQEDASITRDYGIDFNGDHYAIERGISAVIRKRTTATGAWSTVATLPNVVTDLAVFNGKIWASTWGSKMYYSSDGTTWNAYTDSQCFDNICRLLCYRDGLWIIAPDKMKYYFLSRTGLKWDPLDWHINIGDPSTVYSVNGVAVIGGVIAIGRTDGIYIYEGSGGRAEGPIIAFENQAWGWNCRVFTVVDGFLYYNVGRQVKRTDLQGSEFDVTPEITGSTAKEQYGFGIPKGGQGRQGHIYVAFDDMEGLYPVVLEMPTIDIGGWRMVYKGASGATMTGCWFSDVADRLLLNDGATRTQRFQPHSDAPYPDYVASAEIITSRFDAGDVWSKKVFRKILTWARELTSTETIKLYFEKDYSGAWVLVDTLTSGTQNESYFDPNNIANSARKWGLKILLSRGATTSKTPVLILPIVVSYVVRPDPVYAQQTVVRLQEGIMTHPGTKGRYTLTAADITTLKAFLRTCEAYEFPVELKDRYGDTWDVFITRTEELRSFRYPTDLEGGQRQEDVMVLTMREV